jgi:hypothetical protein
VPGEIVKVLMRQSIWIPETIGPLRISATPIPHGDIVIRDSSRIERGMSMIVIRNVFRLKYGKAREALPLVKEALEIQRRVISGVDFSTRVLTDVTGPFYTLVLELTVPSLASFEANAPRLFADKDFQANQQKMVPLVDSGHREIFTIAE